MSDQYDDDRNESEGNRGMVLKPQARTFSLHPGGGKLGNGFAPPTKKEAPIETTPPNGPVPVDNNWSGGPVHEPVNIPMTVNIPPASENPTHTVGYGAGYMDGYLASMVDQAAKQGLPRPPVPIFSMLPNNPFSQQPVNLLASMQQNVMGLMPPEMQYDQAQSILNMGIPNPEMMMPPQITNGQATSSMQHSQSSPTYPPPLPPAKLPPSNNFNQRKKFNFR